MTMKVVSVFQTHAFFPRLDLPGEYRLNSPRMFVDVLFKAATCTRRRRCRGRIHDESLHSGRVETILSASARVLCFLLTLRGRRAKRETVKKR